MKIISNNRSLTSSKRLDQMTADDIFLGFDNSTPCVRVFDAPGLGVGDGAVMRLTDNHVDYVAGADEFRLLYPQAGLAL